MTRRRGVTPAALPVWQGVPDDAALVTATIDAWAASAAMGAVVAVFGGSVGSRRGADLLGFLDGFSAEHWDFRGGRERNLADSVTLTPEQEFLVGSLAAELGLAGIEEPRHPHYDTVIMTGGMIRAGIVKPRFVAELLAGGLRLEHVVFLGGFRPFAGDELRLAEVLDVQGGEFGAMVAGMERAFGPLGPPEVDEHLVENPNASWRSYRWRAHDIELSVLAAPSADPGNRRANTVDTYRFWAERCRTPAERSVLVVTTPIYVPHQGAGAVEILGVEYGLAVETVGTSASASDLGEYTQPFLPGHHLQELRSAIRSMRSLRTRVAPRA